MMLEILIWIFFIYAVFKFVKSSIQSAVRRGIRDYEVQQEKQRQAQKEVKVDPRKIQDADYEDLK